VASSPKTALNPTKAQAPLEEIACILCGAINDRVVIEENGYQGRLCARCGLIYISPRPLPAAIINLYDHDQAHIAADWHLRVETLKRLNARYELALIGRHRPPRGAVLEIGAGAGLFLDEARRLGYAPHAIELNPLQARFIRERLHIPCEEAPLSARSFGDRRFDLIYHSDILSHLPDPIGTMEEIAAKLASAGLLVFETGNYAEVDPRYYPLIGSFQYPDHLFFFGEASLRQLLVRTGFELLTITRYSTVPQLRLLELIARRRRGAAPAIGASDAHARRRRASWFRHRLQPPYQLFLHLLRYRAGAVHRAPGAPQTLILVARKAARSI
jgi:SAM-dependent methyltransferase